MFRDMDNLKIINICSGMASTYKEFRNRPSHVLVFRINGGSEYTFQHKKIKHSQNELLFIPEGESYTVRRICKEEGRYILINFSAEFKNAVAQKYKLDHVSDLSFMFDKLLKLWLFQNTSNYYMCLSLVYKIFSLIAQSEEKNYCSSEQKSKLKPAIEYLQEHIFDCDLKIEMLHTFCGISDTYFRKLFIAEFGIAPKQYITNKRLTQAKDILDNGDFRYVYEVAECVGYTDALYFSRIFKKCYGYAPSALWTGYQI